MKLLGSFPRYDGDSYTYLFYGKGGFVTAFSSFFSTMGRPDITLFSHIERFPLSYQILTFSELDKMQDFVVLYHE